MRVSHLSICAIFLVLTIPESALAMDCSRTSTTIDAREGTHNTGLVDFRFASRVQSYSKFGKEYVWCVENQAKYQAAEFKWGSGVREDLYVSGVVVPRQVLQVSKTDSSETRLEPRVLKFRPLNRSTANAIEPETIFFKRLGEKPGQRLAQIIGGGIIGSSPAPIIDLAELSKDETAFQKLVADEKSIVFFTKMITTVPTTSAVDNVVSKHSYDNYQSDDFVQVEIVLANQLFYSNNSVIALVEIQVGPPANRLLRFAPDLTIRVDPVDFKAQPAASLLKFAAPLSSDSSRKIFVGPAKRVAHVDVVLSIQSPELKVTYASLPTTVLMPTLPGT